MKYNSCLVANTSKNYYKCKVYMLLNIAKQAKTSGWLTHEEKFRKPKQKFQL